MSITPPVMVRPTAIPTPAATVPQIIYIQPQPNISKPNPKKKVSPGIPATIGGIVFGGIPVGRLLLASYITPSIWKNPYARGAVHFAVARAILMTAFGALAGATVAYVYNKTRGNK